MRDRGWGGRRVLVVGLVAVLVVGAGGRAVAQVGEAAGAKLPGKFMALTVDDLPGMNATDMKTAEVVAMNRKLVAALVRAKVPATGFVNEERLYKTGEVDARIGVLAGWVEAGFDLGNHTFSHTSLNEAGLAAWEDDVVQGETVTRMLMDAHKKTLKYLRQPYLDDGADLETGREAVAWLTARKYRVAPVTVDPRDWYFADIYDDAHERGDMALMEKIAAAWLTYTGEVLMHDEELCRRMFGYQPKQVMLLHDTWMEADHVGELIALLRQRGYALGTVDAALTDPAYASPDTYVSDVGATSLVHWAVTRGVVDPPETQPVVPAWVLEKHKEFDAEDAK